MIHPTKIVCEIYGQEGEEEIPLEGYNSLPEEISGRPIFLEQYRTRVRPGNRMLAHFSSMTVQTSSMNLRVYSQILTTHLVNNEVFLKQKYLEERMSARRIAKLLGCSHDTVNASIRRLGIHKNNSKGGQIPYGYKVVRHRVVECKHQQKNIQQMLAKSKQGWSCPKIANWLNRYKTPNPKGKRWYAATVRRILYKFQNTEKSDSEK
jgi:hypothetical protein